MRYEGSFGGLYLLSPSPFDGVVRIEGISATAPLLVQFPS